MISYDGFNWIDAGILKECPLAKDKYHINTHIGEIFYKKEILEIILLEDVYNDDSSLNKYEFKYNPEDDFEEFIKKIKI